MTVETGDGNTEAFQDRITRAVAKTTSVALREVLALSFLERSPKPRVSRRGLSFDPPRRVAVFSNQGAGTSALCLSLTRAGYIPLVLSNNFTLTGTWHKTFERFAEICIIDIDAIATTNDPIDFCRFLRQRHPNLPIILTSATFTNSDLTDERSHICDASFPAGVGRPELLEAISAALSNNLSCRLKQEMSNH